MKTNFKFIAIVFFFFSVNLFSQVTVNDEYFYKQWYLYMPGDDDTRADIRVLDAWARTFGNSTQKIADIEDSPGGIPSHDDLLNRVSAHNAYEVGEHATNIAGILVANHNDEGIAGINKYAHLNSYVYSTKDEWADRIYDAVVGGNQIINISQNLNERLADVAIRLSEAYSNNITTVVSSGNNNSSVRNPAGYPSVIAVGASTKDNTRASWSNYGPELEFLAPGGSVLNDHQNEKNIYTTSSNGLYTYNSGTSFAAPMVTGAASLLLSYKPNLTNEDVKNILIHSCDKLSQMQGADFTNECGYGRINLKKAMQLLEPPYSLTHGDATLTLLNDNIQYSFLSNPIIPYGVYFVDRYKLSVDLDDIQYLEPPKAWLPKGYSPSNPNTSAEYLNVNTTNNSVHAYTYFYYVRTDAFCNPINIWLPFNPSAVYTILGKSAIIKVPQEYSTIEAALAVAIPGQTIKVTGSHTVSNDLSVKSGITLSINSGSTITFASGKKITVFGGGTLNADGATFCGNGTKGSWYSICYYGNSSGSIQNSTIKDAQCGVFATSAVNVTLSGNTITNNSLYGVSCLLSDLSLSNCTISNNGAGAYFYNSDVEFYENSVLNNTDYGIRAKDIGNSYYWHDNDVHGNGYAMLLDNASPWIGHSNFTGNAHGIVITSATPSFAVKPPLGTQMRGFNSISCNLATPNFKAENYSNVYMGYDFDGGYNSIYGSELPDMESVNHSGIYADNNYWRYSPAVYSDGTSWILARTPLSVNPNPECSYMMTSSKVNTLSQTELTPIGKSYFDAINLGVKGEYTVAKKMLLTIIDSPYDAKFTPLALLSYYNFIEKEGLGLSAQHKSAENLDKELESALEKIYLKDNRNKLKPFALRLLARSSALSRDYQTMIKYNTEIIENYYDTTNVVSALYDLTNYYFDIENNLVKGKEYLDKMNKLYPDEDLTMFANMNIEVEKGLAKEKIFATETISEYQLSDNFPNPFNPSTTITFALPQKGEVVLKIYNSLGQEVKTLVNEFKEEGIHKVNFDASNLPSGVYIYSIQANDFMQSKKMILLK